MSEERGENFFTELLKFIIIAAAIVIPVRIYVAQPFIVSGASMEPTFDNGEYLIVDELSYRFNDRGSPERDGAHQRNGSVRNAKGRREYCTRRAIRA
ncbi:MAG: Signal peptidase I [Candidatus Adlerbacteria bacterium GW2011_GWA1_54_10]|uniref:Signal peptidase I n=1 Tax=Candidatus Adlerbacteria bacterium GW2011_GWA1_54_10 TaxID=1618605 RepID=A0A0G1XX73_9BACT|nr:MAG: Signal peptidase I [Candidatus Adlerbacteria bacterium GW2011_GWA1_54_10]